MRTLRDIEVVSRLRPAAATSAPHAFSLGIAIREPGEPVDATIRRADQQLIGVRSTSAGRVAGGPVTIEPPGRRDTLRAVDASDAPGSR